MQLSGLVTWAFAFAFAVFAGCGSGGGGGPGGGGSGGGACAPRLDCNGDPADACEVDPANDPAHCGACGHSCLGGACSAGRCMPVALASQVQTYDLALDGDTVFATAGGTVGSIPKAGGTFALLAPASNFSRDLVIAGGRIYWGAMSLASFPGFDSILSVPLAGGTPQSEREDAYYPCGFATNGTDLFWQETEQKRIYKRPIEGGEPVALLNAGLGCAVAADASLVVWVDAGAALTQTGRVLSATPAAFAAGGPIVPIAERQFEPADVALTADYVYWTEPGDYFETYKNGILKRAARGGGDPEWLIENLWGPGALAVDATHVYVLETGSDRVWRYPVAGGPGEVIAETPGVPIAIALDDVAIYFSTRVDDSSSAEPDDDVIYRLAK
jgi:sugar lactone lactonase YvrE